MNAIAIFQNKIKGFVRFSEVNNNEIKIDVHLSGLKKNALHGFHVHEYGDMSSCESMCMHFNPYNKTHGCPGMKNRHVGDLGNLISDKNGNAEYSFYDDIIKLKGKCNIIGRGLIIHAEEDDCGKGGNPDSLKTGNSGKRIACSVIGYAKEK
jgi:Cu-Zn family superoxide dismutase